MAQLLAPAFGNGSDGVLTISSNTTDSPIDSSCSGSSGSTSLSATNASFAAGQLILCHQTRGTGVGQWELNKIASYTAGTITTLLPLSYTYTDSGASQAQVLVVKQYSGITVNTGITLTAKAWDGNVGGIIALACSGKVTITGTISASGKGFVGGTARSDVSNAFGYCGEGTAGASVIKSDGSANGNGACSAWTADNANYSSGGSGGGNGTAGTSGEFYTTDGAITPGEASGTADLTTMTFGGGGGGAIRTLSTGVGDGGAGGGIIFITGTTITITGSIVSLGVAGASAQVAAGGGGAGGAILLKTQTATLGTTLMTATGGAGGIGTERCDGGAGAVGRIRVEYQSLTGTTNPSASTAYYYFGTDFASII